MSLEFNDACWQRDFILVTTPHKFGLLGRDVLSQAAVTPDFCSQVLEQLPAIRGFKASVQGQILLAAYRLCAFGT